MLVLKLIRETTLKWFDTVLELSEQPFEYAIHFTVANCTSRFAN